MITLNIVWSLGEGNIKTCLTAKCASSKINPVETYLWRTAFWLGFNKNLASYFLQILEAMQNQYLKIHSGSHLLSSYCRMQISHLSDTQVKKEKLFFN